MTCEISLVHYLGKPLFEKTVSLLAYPIEVIFSEKLQTIISKGENNSRMKDYHDLLLLIRAEHMIDINKLQEAIVRTFSNRGTSLHLITFNQFSLKSIQKLWTAHLLGLGDKATDLALPNEISSLINEVNAYLSVFDLDFLSL